MVILNCIIIVDITLTMNDGSFFLNQSIITMLNYVRTFEFTGAIPPAVRVYSDSIPFNIYIHNNLEFIKFIRLSIRS